MRTHPTLKVASALAALFVVALCVAEVQSRQQPRRRQPSRRVTNPVSPQPVPTPVPRPTPADEPRLVSTADETQDSSTQPRRTRRGRAGETTPPQEDESRKALEQLSTEVSRLNKKVDDLEKQRRVDLIMERLARAEQRAEAVQAQVRETMEKEANLQARLDQLEEASRPESLDRQIAMVGSFRPDEERERLRRQYENEKKRVRDLMDVNAKQRQRLEMSLLTADQLVQRLRAQLDEETRKEVEADAAAASGEDAARPSASPTPTPTPPPPR